MSRPVRSLDRRRLVIVALGTFTLFALLVAQFFTLQVVQGQFWLQKAHAQHDMIVVEPFQRGTFWSNTTVQRSHITSPQPLVMDVPKFHLHIDPMVIGQQHASETAAALWEKLDLTSGERENFSAQFYRRSRDRRLAMWLDRERRDAIMEWWLPFAKERRIARNGIFFVADFQRSHPYGKLLGQVLHTIRDYKEESTRQGVPTGGLESYFNEQLKGRQGRRLIKRSPRQKLAMGEVLEEPENGADIHLTINHYLQAIAEEELKKGVVDAQGKSGWAVVLQPQTGEILALAHYPFFDPSHYRDYFASTDKMEATRVKAISDPFEPGSIMKPLTLALCLLANEEVRERGEEPLFDPEAKFPVSNGAFPGRSKPLRDPSFHRYLNADLAIQRSSNIYPARLVHLVVDRLGAQWYSDHLLRVFGIGDRTRIELPAESSGLLPTPQGKYSSGSPLWSASTPSALAIGYNLLTTSIQMARAYAILANGGLDIQPTLIRDVIQTDSRGQPRSVLDDSPVSRLASRERLLPESIAKRVVHAMKYVTRSRGYSRHADIPGYSEAGKSGTAVRLTDGHYRYGEHTASFAGFTPVESPELVIIVTIDGTKKYGGQAAGPVFREIGRRSLVYLGVPEDDPFGYPLGNPKRDPERAYWVSEARQLQTLYDSWNSDPPSSK